MAIVKNGVASYVGRVLGIRTACERVMSDIYADVTRADVVEPDGAVKSVYVKAHFELDDANIAGTAADAGPEVAALAKARAEVNCCEYLIKRLDGEIAAAKAGSKKGAPKATDYLTAKAGDLVLVKGKVAGLNKGDIHTLVWVGTSKFDGTARYAVLVDGKKVYAGSSKFDLVVDDATMVAAEAKAAEVAANAKKVADAKLTKLLDEHFKANANLVLAKDALAAAADAAAPFFVSEVSNAA